MTRTFDESKVFTTMNATKATTFTKGWFANTKEALKKQVENDMCTTIKLIQVLPDTFVYRFIDSTNDDHLLFYPKELEYAPLRLQDLTYLLLGVVVKSEKYGEGEIKNIIIDRRIDMCSIVIYYGTQHGDVAYAIDKAFNYLNIDDHPVGHVL